MKKRLLICSDGTWQSLESPYATNVVKILQSILPQGADGAPQIIYYDPGVGTHDPGDRVSGGAVGEGLDIHLADCYRFLALNWEPGDEIYLFGFSRGSYTVRTLGGMIHNCGLVHREHLRQVPAALRIYRDRLNHPGDAESRAFQQAYSRMPAITALCCFDTVGSMGIPDMLPFLPFDKWVDAKYRFHDTTLSPIIEHAFHACGIDEHRKVFDITPMDSNVAGQLSQVWFPGDHGCIGGGSVEKAPLSDVTLQWMLDSLTASGLGLAYDTARIPGGVAGNPTAPFKEDRGAFDFVGLVERNIPAGATFHPSVKARWKADPKYRPKNLAAFKNFFDAP